MVLSKQKLTSCTKNIRISIVS